MNSTFLAFFEVVGCDHNADARERIADILALLRLVERHGLAVSSCWADCLKLRSSDFAADKFCF